jgi:hypothetical protein
MAIKKQEFYEGAALHRLARTSAIMSIRYEAPFFVLNNEVSVYLKYSTKSRSPWGFTFTTDEQLVLRNSPPGARLVIGLICGADGVVTLTYDSYTSVAAPRKVAIHIACYRKHGEHYEVNGPDGCLAGKVAPASWQKIL